MLKLKLKIKNALLFLLLAIFSFAPIFTTYAFKSPYPQTNLTIESSSGEKNESEEDADVFEFIKDKKNSLKDFFYDGSALLYGGILLIIISVLGIFKTLKPKKKKKKRRPRNNSENNRVINNRR